MEELAARLSKLKAKFQKAAEADQGLKNAFGEVFAKIFPTKNLDLLIRGFYFRQSVLFIETTNKVFANELFLKREVFLAELKKLGFSNLTKIITR